MKTSMPVVTDGVNMVDAAEGDLLEVGAGVGENLIEHGHAAAEEPTAEPKPSRGRKHALAPTSVAE
jgi:hypothetical protein